MGHVPRSWGESSGERTGHRNKLSSDQLPSTSKAFWDIAPSLPLSLLKYLSLLPSSLRNHFLLHKQSCDRGATTHSSRSASSAAPPPPAASVWGGAGRRWLVCSKLRCRWRRPAACGGPLGWFWHQWRSLWIRYLGDHWTRGGSAAWQRPSVSLAPTASEHAPSARLPRRWAEWWWPSPYRRRECCHWRAAAEAWTLSWRWGHSVCCCHLWGWWVAWACLALLQLLLVWPAREHQ